MRSAMHRVKHSESIEFVSEHPCRQCHDALVQPLLPFADVATIDTTLDSRAITFENPTGARGAGGSAHGGRKGAPSRRIRRGERVVLADIEGPGTINHLWLTVPPAPPEQMRALVLEVFYDDATEPSISVPVLDFFGLPHGRPVAVHTALTAVQEGRGFNSFVPIPFDRKVRVEFLNASERSTILYFQIDYTLQPSLPSDTGFLHVTFRRQNPTVLRDDFTIVDGLSGPGRFLGCVVGVRVIDPGDWYGEGEVKVFLDGDTDLPTICGTGLEDYVGSAWGMGAHAAPYGGAPLVVREGPGPNPSFVGFYRWHVPDPIVFRHDLRATIQQIGAKSFLDGQDEQLAEYERTNPVAGAGWVREHLPPTMLAWGIAERVDDYCAAAFVYCTRPQPVSRVDVELATADLARGPGEAAGPFEVGLGTLNPS
jgi:hypothetical protein